VIGTNATTLCVSPNSNAVNVSATANPAALILTGDAICASPGGDGKITSSVSLSGVTYQLFNAVNVAVQAAKAGTGSVLTWTGLPAGNGYYVIGTNASTCTSTSNTVNISSNANPSALVLAGSTICVSPGGNGTITSTTSVIGVNYQLHNSSDAPVQGVRSGTGSVLTWSSIPAGTGYYVVSTNSSFCTATSSAVSVLTTPNPTAPIAGTVTQPTCGVATGSVILNGLPGTGTWTLTRNPGGTTSTGIGSSYTVTGLTGGVTYSFTVTNEFSCISPVSNNIVINTQPPTPGVPDQTTSILTGSAFTVTPIGVPVGTTYTWLTPTYTNGVYGGSAQPSGQSNISGTLFIPSGTGTAVYTVTPVTGACAGNTFTVTVTVTSNCVPVTILTNPANASMCRTAGSASFTVVAGETSPFVYQWKYYNGSAWVNVTNGTPSGATYANAKTATLGVAGITSAGNYQYQCYITNCSGANNATSAAAVLTVNSPPAAPTVGTINQPTCTVSTGKVVLSNLPDPWTLTRTPGAVVTSGTGTSTTVEYLAAATTYTYTVTNAAGCTSSASSSIVIDPQPTTPNAPSIGTITAPTCTVSTGSVVLNGLPAAGWTLTRYPNAVTTTGTGTITTISSLLPGSYNYTVTNTGGCVSPASSTVEIPSQPANPSAPVVGKITQPTCVVATGSVVLSGLPAGGWTINPGGKTGSGTSTTISGLSSGTYNYTYTNTSGCISLVSADVVINTQPPTPGVSNQTTVIATGETFTVTPGGVPAGTTYTWSAPSYTNGVTGGSAQTSPQSNISGTLTIPTGTGTATYTVTPAAGACVGATFTVTVTVTSTCTPVAVTTQPVNSSMCATSGSRTFAVVAGGSAPFVYQWKYYNGSTWVNVSNGNPSGSTYTNATAATLTVSGITNSGNYQYRCYITNCSGVTNVTSNTATLTVNALPAAPIIGTITQPTCGVPSGSVVLSGLPSDNWTINPGAVTGSGTSTTITGLPSGIFNFTVTNSLSCTSLPSSDFVINESPALPAAPVASVTQQPTCSAATGTITVTSPAAGTGYEYSIGGSYQSGTSFTGLPSGSFKVTVRRTTDNLCVSPATTLTVDPQPLKPVVVVTDPSACSPLKVDLTAPEVTEGSTSGLSYTYWTDPAASIEYSTPAEADAGTYYIKGTTSAGCYDIKPVIATVNQSPVANAGPDTTLQYIFKIKMAAQELKVDETGKWTLISGSAVFEDDTDPLTMVTELAPGENILLWTVSNAICPPSEDYIAINITDLVIPTLITPNGDQYNEYFELRGIESLGTTKLVIFDRRGAQVFRDDNYENDWNGLDQNGEMLPDDTYFYTIKSQNGKSASGYIVIRR
jgi:gliding motility-associated-like protein